ncbi:MAG: GNAT family N-acetyltransferase [Clostridia bacterium]|nr:GNAT family N-acetyltransferase [Clostridia bacterium]MBR0081124.1 GNAT family N-acetyltransferase [Clostridia bacterium]
MLKIAPLSEELIPEIAPLAAQFRVTLQAFRGITVEPNAAAGAEELREYRDAGFPMFAANLDGTYCGYLVCRVDEPCVWVESIFVLPAYRRQGVAAALYQQAEEIAASFGEDTVYNYVHPNNAPMIAFLKSKGYTVLNLIEIRKPYRGERLTQQIPVGENRFDY